MASLLRLIILLAVCLSVGFLGSLATRTSVDTWYVELSKPSWTPPDWVFGPVWTSLYILMAVAAWWVWPRAGRKRGLSLLLFSSQLLLNLIWSYLFFGMRWPGGAAIEIVVLLAFILATLWTFAKVSRLAGLLLAPYAAWVGFAMVLNFEIWRLNS